jgi:hypothetical protein
MAEMIRVCFSLIVLFLVSTAYAIHPNKYIVGEITFQDKEKGYVIILNEAQYQNTLEHWKMNGPFVVYTAPFDRWFYALTDKQLCPISKTNE